MQPNNLEKLEQSLGYRFRDRSLLVEALTHSSYANELKARKQAASCNERLEFLGDSVLSIVVSEFLFKKYGKLPEGELTQRRAALVRSQALASYARSIHLGDYLLLGNGERKYDGKNKPTTLENAFEALLGAIVRAKPAAAKGQYIRSCTVASTMGPGVKINPNKVGV